MFLYSKNIYFPNQIKREGYLKIEDGIITDFKLSLDGQDFIDHQDDLIIPGFIDQHLHGWATGNYNAIDPIGGLTKMQETLPFAGVTSFLATTGAWPIEDLKTTITKTTDHMNKDSQIGSQVLGIHLEGPFVSLKQAGMMNKAGFADASTDVMQDLLDSQTQQKAIKLMTMAPELDNAKDLIKFCHNNNVQLNIGHSDSDFDTIAKLKEFGLGGVTHMYSGMRGFHHRELGVAGAALYFDDLYCEFAKQTGWTVLPEAFALAYKLKGPERIIMTTDNVGMAQITNERYHYIRKQTFIPAGDKFILRNDDGSEIIIDRFNYEEVKDLELSYIKSIQNLIANVNPSVHEVIKMTAENPAKYIGVSDRKGSIEIGKDADLLVVDKDFNLKHTYCRGQAFKVE